MDTLVISPLVIGQLDSDPLETSRNALVEGASSTGQLIANYAQAMCMRFNIVDASNNLIAPWYSLIGKEKKGVKAERALFVQKMIARGFVKPDGKPSATVDTYWQRVKEESGYVPKGRVTGGTDVDSKTVTELKTIINRIFKAEEDGQDPLASQFKGQLMEIFEGLGGDVDTLG
jgi:hypothetical protein